jgi:hypothetical protein
MKLLPNATVPLRETSIRMKRTDMNVEWWVDFSATDPFILQEPHPHLLPLWFTLLPQAYSL